MTDDQARNVFIRTLSERYQFAEGELQSFAQCYQVNNLAEQDHWIKAGDVTKEMCHIVSGLLRVYYIDDAGNEVNQNFYQAGEFIAPVSVMISNEPCQYYVQAIEPSVLLLASSESLLDLGRHNSQWLRLENHILKEVFLKTAKREAKLLMCNAEQRYTWFLKEYADLAQRIAQYHIASFLGITPVSLSRLRKKLEA